MQKKYTELAKKRQRENKYLKRTKKIVRKKQGSNNKKKERKKERNKDRKIQDTKEIER